MKAYFFHFALLEKEWKLLFFTFHFSNFPDPLSLGPVIWIHFIMASRQMFSPRWNPFEHRSHSALCQSEKEHNSWEKCEFSSQNLCCRKFYLSMCVPAAVFDVFGTFVILKWHFYMSRSTRLEILIQKHMRESKIGLLQQIWASKRYHTFFLGHPVEPP